MIKHDDTDITPPNANNKICCNECSTTSCCISTTREPSDLCLKFSFFLIGTGFLFPYNSVVTAIDFFAQIYFASIDFVLGWLLLAPSIVILCVTLKYGYWGSIYQRIIGTFLFEGILTIVIALVRNVYIVFIATFILGSLSAVLQGTLFSLLGFLGSDMMAITQTGIGCSGVLVGIVRIVTKVFIPNDIKNSTYLYFLLAFIMVLVDILVYVFILHPSTRVQKAIYQDTQKNESLHNKSNRLKRVMKVNEVTSILNVDKENENKNKMKNYNACNPDRIGSGEERKINNATGSDSGVHNDKPLSLRELFCVSWRCQIAVFLNYTLTLSLFPGVISLMQWDNSGDEWFAVIQIFLFNLLDTFGKNLTTYKFILNLFNNHNILLIASICRLLFIPLFVMCVKPAIFSWQIAMIINGAMGITNGVVGTSGFCLGPQSSNLPKHEKGRTSQMLAFSLTCGLFGGASLAFVINFVMNNYL